METIKKYLYAGFGVLVAVLFGIIYYLSGKNEKLRYKVGSLSAERDLRDTLLKKADAEREANEAEDVYNEFRNRILSSEPDDSSDDTK